MLRRTGARLAGHPDVDDRGPDLLDQRGQAAPRVEVAGDHRGAGALAPQRLARGLGLADEAQRRRAAADHGQPEEREQGLRRA
jgi:hypothetical protein